MGKDWTGSKYSVFRIMGASNHSGHERQNEDYYATEPKATALLCGLEKFNADIWEPACGEGHISEELKRNGYNVLSTDLVDRGYGGVGDFLSIDNQEWGGILSRTHLTDMHRSLLKRLLA